jgi:hypothetical protein
MPTVDVNFLAATGSITVNVNPTRVHVPQGTQTLTWILSGTPGAALPSNAIVFKPGSGWSFGSPTTAPGGQSSSITYNNNVGVFTVYNYTISITYNGVTYSYDPEVGNDPPGSMDHEGGGGHHGDDGKNRTA